MYDEAQTREDLELIEWIRENHAQDEIARRRFALSRAVFNLRQGLQELENFDDADLSALTDFIEEAEAARDFYAAAMK